MYLDLDPKPVIDGAQRTRARALDAIPFKHRLRFDTEASFGTDMREKWDMLGYSTVTFFYAQARSEAQPPADAGFGGEADHVAGRTAT